MPSNERAIVTSEPGGTTDLAYPTLTTWERKLVAVGLCEGFYRGRSDAHHAIHYTGLGPGQCREGDTGFKEAI